MSTTHALLEHLFDRLTEQRTSDQTAEVVLGAFAGERQLRVVLDGAPADLPVREAETAEQRHVFLERITVTGFRGIGAKAALHLQPQPGLTLVIGRNGSGKSSFAEAVELSLTGDSKRWAENNRIFREGWRNLHHPDQAAIEVTARLDGSPAPVHLRRRWRDDAAEPSDAAADVRHGDQTYADVDALGWRQPLEAYRPLLTANDLGRLISSRPSDLFDALAPLLAIEPITNAESLLKQIRRELDTQLKAVSDRRKSLRQALGGVDDERARAAAKLLASTRPDLDAVDRLLGNTDDVDPQVTAYRRLVSLPPLPTAEEVTAVADTLTAAAVCVREAPDSSVTEGMARLLEAATEHYDAHGGGPCPLCRASVLDQHWRTEAQAELDRIRDDAAARRSAMESLAVARRKVQALPVGAGVPTTLPEDFPADLRERLRTAWTIWSGLSADADPEAVATHLTSTYPALLQTVAAVREAAILWLQARHDQWRDLAAQLQQWHADAVAARVHEAPLARVKEALDWYKPLIENLRAEQLAPFAARSQQIWEELRQESHVELAGMKLDGSSTRRRVAFPATWTAPRPARCR